MPLPYRPIRVLHVCFYMGLAPSPILNNVKKTARLAKCGIPKLRNKQKMSKISLKSKWKSGWYLTQRAICSLGIFVFPQISLLHFRHVTVCFYTIKQFFDTELLGCILLTKKSYERNCLYNFGKNFCFLVTSVFGWAWKLKSNFLIFDLLKLFTLYFYRILWKLLCFFLKVRRKSKLWYICISIPST